MDINVPRVFDKDPIYVKDMTNFEALEETNVGIVNFGAALVASNSTLRAAISATADVRVKLPGVNGILVNDFFGRTITVTSGALTNVTLVGRDYLNQAITELVVLGSDTTVTSLKAFKFLDFVTSTVTTTVGLGRGAGLGLPFVAVATVREFVSTTPTGLKTVVGTAGVVTPAVVADPTNATGDTRGTYAPNTTMNGTNIISAEIIFNPDSVDGLYGRPHFAG